MEVCIAPFIGQSQGYSWKISCDGCEIFSGTCDSVLQAQRLALQNLLAIHVLESQNPSVILVRGLVRVQNTAHLQLFGSLQGHALNLDEYQVLETKLWPNAILARLSGER